ncbi:MAG: glycerol-3-phosphate 1-O-acyltransferase PlsY [Gammaproteobacteria bacterium]|nr:glycerol-3-phosphate 1-O-acyltransferase PlsY [Gammaproteobacteria bacterium]
MIIVAIILSAVAYIIGSLSSAIIVCKFLNLPDPRTTGSMNPGATNVLRIGGKTPAIITLAGDMLKGFIPVLVAHLIGISGFFLGLVALSAVLGHIFPIFFNFKGGKGVATALGAFLGLSLIAGIAIITCWVLVAAILRYSSLASIIAALVAPILMLIFANAGYLLPMLMITLLLICGHMENIKRLRSKTESKINF